MPRWTGPAAGSEPAPALQIRAADRIEIRAESVGQLRAQLSSAALSGRARALDLALDGWRAPWPGWSGRLGPLPGLVHHDVHLPERGLGAATVSITLAEPVTLWRIVAAALSALEPCRPLPSTISPEVVNGHGPPPPWMRPEASAPDQPGAEPTDTVIRPYDVRLTQASGRTFGLALIGSPYGVSTAGGAQTVIVDATSANPRGRQRYGPELSAGSLTVIGTATGYWWQIAAAEESAVVAAGRVGDPLDERQSSALLELGTVAAGDTVGVPPHALAAALAQLAMTGVVLHAPALEDGVGALLAPDLLALLGADMPGRLADPIEWEIRSIAQRRAALRRHATAFALPAAAVEAYRSLVRPPAVSALLVTRRPQHVAPAVAALAKQSYPDLEIVVGLHGFGLSAEERDQLVTHGVPVHVTAIPADMSFGEALGIVTRQASGSLVTKVDDDDRYGPEHVWDLVLARHYSGATLVGKGAEFVYLEPYDTAVRRRMGSELYTDVVAGGTMLLSRGDLEAVGGWRPLARSVDRGLLDRVLREGGLVYRTHGFGFVYTRHTDGHTWDPGFEYFLHDPRSKWRGLPPYDEFGAR